MVGLEYSFPFGIWPFRGGYPNRSRFQLQGAHGKEDPRIIVVVHLTVVAMMMIAPDFHMQVTPRLKAVVIYQ